MKKSGDTVVIIWIPRGGIRLLFSDFMVNNFGWISALSKNKIPFQIYKKKDIGRFYNKTIILNYHRNYLKNFDFTNYSDNMFFIVKQLESQGNRVIPASNEIAYWENKNHMTNEFARLNISTPKTYLKKSLKEVMKLKLDYPFLIKEEHSASSIGVHKVTNEERLREILQDNYFEKNEVIIVQELLNLRRDLRVIFVGGKIVHHYWRINNAKEWKPTSTGRGSSVDFENFPEEWRMFLIDEFLKMDLSTGAFDVAWRDDNLESIPYILEVSPNYQMNPSVTNQENLNAYGDYKKSLYFGEESYDYKYISQTFEIIEELAKLKKIKQV
jgi:glutathione synthase/RimK-type ligase-like ATP-grasp enzyme